MLEPRLNATVGALLYALEAEWPVEEADARRVFASVGLDSGEIQAVGGTSMRSAALVGLPAAFDSTWWVGEGGVEVDMFIATARPTHQEGLRRVFDESAAEFDRRWPGARRISEEARASWRTGGMIIDLDCICTHDAIGVVQLHLRPGAAPDIESVRRSTS